MKLARVRLNRHLKYKSLAAAMAALPGPTKATFARSEAKLEVPYWGNPEEAAGLHLRAWGTIPGGQQCLYVDLNLMTGQAARSSSYCGPVH